jgi:hypothetical protein
MKRLHLAMWILLGTAWPTMQAQSTTVMRADIPFEFRVGDSEMPAGSYQIDYTAKFVTFREQNGKHALIRLLAPVTRLQTSTEGTLEFHRYDNDYFLAKIWAPYSESGGAVPKTELEKEVASRMGAPHRTEVALHSK